MNGTHQWETRIKLSNFQTVLKDASNLKIGDQTKSTSEVVEVTLKV